MRFSTHSIKQGGHAVRMLLILMLCLGMILPACATRDGRTYSDGEARTVQRVQQGTVLDVTPVMVEEDSSLLGPTIGGVAGGFIGSVFGSGTGRILAAIGGAAIGALAGTAVEHGIRRYEAQQLTMRMENGDTLIVVQGGDEVFVKNDRVRVITGDSGSARVQHI